MTNFDTDVSVPSTVVPGSVHDESGKPEWWTDDGCKNSWQDTYTARRRVFPDGQCEVTVSKDRFFLGPAMTPQTRAKRGESEKREANEEDSARRARKTVRHRCKAICADRLVTLTYRENMMDRVKALKDFDKFRRRLKAAGEFHYVAVIEQQARGAIHFHIAVHGRQSYVLLRSIWQSVLGVNEQGQQLGQVNVRDPHRFGFGKTGHHKLAGYISKYCGKQMDVVVPEDFVGPVKPIRLLDEKRYFCSRGIVIPECHSWRVPGVFNQLQALEYAFSMMESRNLEGLETWANNPLGVVYMACGPGGPPF